MRKSDHSLVAIDLIGFYLCIMDIIKDRDPLFKNRKTVLNTCLHLILSYFSVEYIKLSFRFTQIVILFEMDFLYYSSVMA